MEGFTPLDQAVLIVYLILVVGMGAAFLRGQQNTEDYFLAGRRMPWLAVGISIFASLFSAISLLGSPGWVYSHDLTLGLTLVTIPLVTPVVICVFLPFFHRLKVFTAYEYLEHRFNPPVRLAASALFLFQRGSYLAVVIYAPSLVLSTATGLELKWTILLIGGLATGYTLLGGMKAVIWTDVVQACVLFGGLILVVWVLISRVDGGFSEILESGASQGPFRVELSWGDWATISLGAVLINGIFVNLSQYGADQITLQRYLTTPDVRAGRKAMIINALLTLPIGLTLLFIGGALFVFYLENPARLAPGTTGDAVFPHFVIHELPSGVSGVFIAAMFAAAMSTIDSAINSLSTSSMKDFYERYFGSEHGERKLLKVSRLFTLLWGGCSTLLALYIQYFQNILSASKTLAGLFSGSLLGVFILGLLTVRATAIGALTGALAGFVVVASIVTWTSASFLWYAPIGCLVTLLLGYALSCLTSPGNLDRLQGLVIWNPSLPDLPSPTSNDSEVESGGEISIGDQRAKIQ